MDMQVNGQYMSEVVDEVLVAAIAADKSPAEAAELAGTWEVYVGRRLKDSAFLKAVELRRSVYDHLEESGMTSPPIEVGGVLRELSALSVGLRPLAARAMLDAAVRQLGEAEVREIVLALTPFLLVPTPLSPSPDIDGRKE